jgi:hypothetical protein
MPKEMSYRAVVLLGALVGSPVLAQLPYYCPSEREVLNIEVGASSMKFKGMPERDFLLQQAQALRGCRVKLTPDEWRRLKDYHAAQNNLRPEDRHAARIEANDLIRSVMHDFWIRTNPPS